MKGRVEHGVPEFHGRGRSTVRPVVVGKSAAVSTGHPLATLAAMRILDGGGNAIDAGVAAGMALGVLQARHRRVRRRCANDSLSRGRAGHHHNQRAGPLAPARERRVFR